MRLTKLANDPNVNVRLKVAQNLDTPPSVLELLIMDKMLGVRKAAMQNPRISREAIETAAEEDPSRELRQLARFILDRNPARVSQEPETASLPHRPEPLVGPNQADAVVASGSNPDVARLVGRVDILEELASDPEVPARAYQRRVHQALRDINDLHNGRSLTTEDFSALNSRLVALLAD
jgi:hypothetical protein